MVEQREPSAPVAGGDLWVGALAVAACFLALERAAWTLDTCLPARYVGCEEQTTWVRIRVLIIAIRVLIIAIMALMFAYKDTDECNTSIDDRNHGTDNRV